MGAAELGADQSMPDHQNARARSNPRSGHPSERMPASGFADPEVEWIRKIAGGDRSAFEQLFHAYCRRLFGYLFRQVGNKDAAEELTNDVMLSVWKGASGFKGEIKSVHVDLRDRAFPSHQLTAESESQRVCRNKTLLSPAGSLPGNPSHLRTDLLAAGEPLRSSEDQHVGQRRQRTTVLQYS
jgi:hypothetical protein